MAIFWHKKRLWYTISQQYFIHYSEELNKTINFFVFPSIWTFHWRILNLISRNPVSRKVNCITKIYNLPNFGVAPYWKCDCSVSSALLSSSPLRSWSKTSWGTLHPHPFRSANFTSRKLGSNSCAVGSNGRRKAMLLVILSSFT